jgi:periplasmic protein TonB
MILHKVAPNSPEVARQRGVQGTVVIAVTIAKDGTVRDPRVISGDPLLNKAATEAVRKWRYRPYILKGEPVEVETTLEVHFTLN